MVDILEMPEQPYDFVRGYRAALFEMEEWLSGLEGGEDWNMELMSEYFRRATPGFTTNQIRYGK